MGHVVSDNMEPVRPLNGLAHIAMGGRLGNSEFHNRSLRPNAQRDQNKNLVQGRLDLNTDRLLGGADLSISVLWNRDDRPSTRRLDHPRGNEVGF